MQQYNNTDYKKMREILMHLDLNKTKGLRSPF